MNKYIKKSAKQNTLHGRDILMIVHPLPEGISIDNVLRKVEKHIPASMTREVDAIYVGEFDILKKRSLQAMYFKGTIYISNSQKNEDDIYDDLVHEISHSVEELEKDQIYADGTLKREFLHKRQQLFDILEINGYNVAWSKMLNHKFDEELDKYFYWEIGYDKLATLIDGIFITPYSVTSLREYWGKGFEKYVLGHSEVLGKVSPVLHNKIETLFAQTY